MDECKFVVHDDEARILDKEFDNFEDAYDYAQDGLVTFIYRVCGDEEEEIVWSWDDTHDREEAIKRVNGTSETPVEEQVEIEIKADEPEELADLADCVFGGECKFFDTEFEKPVDEVKVEFDPAKFQEYEDECDDCEVEAPENPFTFDFSIKDEKKPEDRPEEDEDSDDEEDEKKDESLEESIVEEDDFDEMTDEEFVEAFGKAKFGNKDLEESSVELDARLTQDDVSHDIKNIVADQKLCHIDFEQEIDRKNRLAQKTGRCPVCGGYLKDLVCQYCGNSFRQNGTFEMPNLVDAALIDSIEKLNPKFNSMSIDEKAYYIYDSLFGRPGESSKKDIKRAKAKNILSKFVGGSHNTSGERLQDIIKQIKQDLVLANKRKTEIDAALDNIKPEDYLKPNIKLEALDEEVKPEEQDLNLDNIPLEVPVEMDIEVEDEVGGDPIADGRTGGDDIRYSDARTIYGKIESYNYEPDFDQVIECLKKMLNKDTLTQADIDAVKEDDYLKFAAEYFEDEAVREVEKKVNQGDTDNLSVKWEDGEDY